MGKMNALILAAALAQGSLGDAQEITAEVTFTRVHLVNGNFIDGELVSNAANEVVLKLKFGEITIRRDRIARDVDGKFRVELVKMRSLTEKAKTIQPQPVGADAGPKLPATEAEATTAFRPSLKMDSARTVAVVVPSPATSLVFEATSFTMRAPMFS